MERRSVDIPVFYDNDPADKYLAALNPEDIVQSDAKDNLEGRALTSLNSLQSKLRNPQDWNSFLELLKYCEYYINYDSMVSGAIKNIFIPFSQAEPRLIGGDEEMRKYFNEFLIRNNFEDILSGLANDYYKYGNTYLYHHKGKHKLQILPPFRCEVEAISVDGEPVISFEIQKSKQRGRTNIDKIVRKYSGYPEEIQKAAKKGDTYAQLTIGSVYAISYSKAAWEKYALPMIVPALPWLIQKETLNNTQMTELKNMRRTFLEVRVGDKDKVPRPSRKEIQSVSGAYQNAIKSDGDLGAFVAWNVESEWKSAASASKDTLRSITESQAFINWNILSALSISPILAAGDGAPNKSSNSSFSTTQAAVGIVNKRINAFLLDVSKMINKIIRAIALEEGVDLEKCPSITFDLVDLSDDKEVSDELMSLYDKGLVSRKTLLGQTKYDYDEEYQNKVTEKDSDADEVFSPPLQSYNLSASDKVGGRPTKDDKERKTPSDDGKNNNPRPSRNK